MRLAVKHVNRVERSKTSAGLLIPERSLGSSAEFAYSGSFLRACAIDASAAKRTATVTIRTRHIRRAMLTASSIRQGRYA